MSEKKILDKMMLRRRFCKKIVAVLIPFILTFYVLSLLFGDWSTPRLMSLTDLNRCPACYGISVCPELYSNQIQLDLSDRWGGIFNAKNIYHGITKFNRRVVLKKLAHDWELQAFDVKMCKTFDLQENCKPIQLLNVSNLDNELIKSVQYNFTFPEITPRKGLIMCPYAHSLHDLILPIVGSQKLHIDTLYIWTMLNINPEPIILQLLKKSAGWPVPSYGGVCGRLEVVADEGKRLSSLTDVTFRKKLKYAQKILEAAMDFTYKHDRFRFYLMDWSLDNIVANEEDDISFVDLEDVLVLDKHAAGGADRPRWLRRHAHDVTAGAAFSLPRLCSHRLSDHNLWAACHALAGARQPLLAPVPRALAAERPRLDRLLVECLSGDDRFKTITTLRQYIKNMLADKKLEGLDTAVS